MTMTMSLYYFDSFINSFMLFTKKEGNISYQGSMQER